MRGLYLPAPPPVEATAELGWLTPLRLSKGDKSYTVFRCRCGTETIRVTRHVRRDAARGLTPKCSKDCTGKAA